MKVLKKLIIISSLLVATLSQSAFYANPVSSGSLISSSSFNQIFKNHCGGIKLEEQITIKDLLSKDLTIKSNSNKPSILIIHSHPQETYATDKQGHSGSVIDVGDELEKILEARYKISVLHLEGDGNNDLVTAYDRMEARLQKVLSENPSIEVIIDIHRDGGTKATATVVNNRSMAKMNIINGLSLDEKVGTIGSLKEYANPYIQDNLSLSTQIKYKSDEVAPELINNIILQKYRYSLHMLPKSLMIDVGNNKDTVEDAMNAVEVFVDVLADVLNLEKVDE